MFPVDEIIADRVAPTHVTPFVAEGIVLIEQVVFAVVINHAIRVVHPISFRCKMESGAKWFLIGWLNHGLSSVNSAKLNEPWERSRQSSTRTARARVENHIAAHGSF